MNYNIIIVQLRKGLFTEFLSNNFCRFQKYTISDVNINIHPRLYFKEVVQFHAVCPKRMTDCSPNMHTLHIVHQQIRISETRTNGALQSLENVAAQPI